MFKIKRLTCVIGCALAVNGCAFTQKDQSMAGIEIKPVTNIRHANASPKIMYLLGRYHQGKVDYPRAIAAYEKALAAKPDYVEVLNGLGVIYSALGQHELSLQHLHKAIQISSQETYLYNNLGYAYLVYGNEAGAAKALEKALLLDPENKRAHHNLLIAHERIALAAKTELSNLAQTDSTFPETSSIALETTQADFNKLDDTEAPPQFLISQPAITPTQAPAYKMAEKYVPDPVLSKETLLPEITRQLGNRDIQIEVSNGNGISGMAKQVSGFFQQYGFAKARLTNHPSFNQNQTEIYYRPNSYQEAHQINQMLTKQARLIESMELRQDVQVKILLGRDFSHKNNHSHFTGKDVVLVGHGVHGTQIYNKVN
ncbi:LytR C-terminal domain-containing protein [Nitrosomonas sp.]|uniref:LytR C-terminal domain-containing protein n=1 Tax=Nitrosomonas sp. TaxID=42353 RepID=UPI00374CFB49